MKTHQFLILSFFLLMALNHCSSSSASQQSVTCEDNCNNSNNPFKGLVTGDDFPWGTFINGAYQSDNINEIPIKVYPVFFSEEEKQVIRDGIELANLAIGYDLYEEVPEWCPTCRPIIKVNNICYEDNAPVDVDCNSQHGHTYIRYTNVQDSDGSRKVVTDWGMELKEDYVNKYLVAHELGHTMGLDHVENNKSLMNARISSHPQTEDYFAMMEKQGRVLIDYFAQHGVNYSIDEDGSIASNQTSQPKKKIQGNTSRTAFAGMMVENKKK